MPDTDNSSNQSSRTPPPGDLLTPPPLQQRQTYYGDPASQVEGCARLAAFLATLISGALLPPIFGAIGYFAVPALTHDPATALISAILGGIFGFALAVIAAIIVLKRG
jgi:hypothetical protein